MNDDSGCKTIREQDIQRALREFKIRKQLDQFDAKRKHEEQRRQKETMNPEPKGLPPASWAWRTPWPG